MDFALWSLIIGWAFVLIWVPTTLFGQRKVHPKALFVLFFAELWERFSFYGMKAVLTVFMVSYLHLMGSSAVEAMPDAKAEEYFHLFTAAVYATP